MKVSKLITTLQEMERSYGDLEVSITLSYPVGETETGIVSETNIFIGYDQHEDHDEINIRSFPY